MDLAPTPSVAERVHDAVWYHTIEIAPGLVTPGEYDLRPVARLLPLPSRLQGMRCLDVGTRDGFWAFEMERRGARKVIGIDLDDETRFDWPGGVPELASARAEFEARARAFHIAHEALGSRVQRLDLSVYDLEPARLGMFDFAFLGTLLLHLRDPIGALTSLRSVLRGHLLLNEPVALGLSLLSRRVPMARLMAAEAVPFWWAPNAAALRRYLEVAGFEILATGRRYWIPRGPGWSRHHSGRRKTLVSVRARISRRGMRHSWILAQPRAPT